MLVTPLLEGASRCHLSPYSLSPVSAVWKIPPLRHSNRQAHLSAEARRCCCKPFTPHLLSPYTSPSHPHTEHQDLRLFNCFVQPHIRLYQQPRQPRSTAGHTGGMPTTSHSVSCCGCSSAPEAAGPGAGSTGPNTAAVLTSG